MALVRTVDLFDQLVARGVSPGEAYEQLRSQLEYAGYPGDYPELSDADANAIRAAILGTPD